MPGRKFNTTGSEFGFNGKREDNEIYGEGNGLDFGDRMYDSRLGRWMSVDPKMKKYTAIAPYTYVNNNPIFWQDKEGKELWLGENRELSIADIKSLVPPRYQSAIVVSSEGKVTLDLSLTTEDAWDGNDAGLNLLQNLIDAPEKYLYEANDMITVTYNKRYPQGEVDP